MIGAQRQVQFGQAQQSVDHSAMQAKELRSVSNDQGTPNKRQKANSFLEKHESKHGFDGDDFPLREVDDELEEDMGTEEMSASDI